MLINHNKNMSKNPNKDVKFQLNAPKKQCNNYNLNNKTTWSCNIKTYRIK